MKQKHLSFKLFGEYHLTLVLNKDLGLVKQKSLHTVFGISNLVGERIDAMTRADRRGFVFLFIQVHLVRIYLREEK